MPRTRIKVCGIKEEIALFAAADAGADAVGFVFHPGSVRFIEPEEAFELASFLPPFVSTVGLFVDAPLEKFMAMEEICPTSFTQLHGKEREDLVKQCGPGVIKTVRFDPATITKELAKWDAIPEVDAILIEVAVGGGGGSGSKFDWKTLAEPLASIKKPLILGGDLTPDNVGDAIRAVRPFGVDVSAGVEDQPGVKSPELIVAFCNAVQRADLDAD